MAKARTVLSKNLNALMKVTPECASRLLLRKKSGLGGGSVDGAVTGQAAATIDTIEHLAAAFGLQPWQLLIPDLDPNNPPVFHLTEAEKAFYKRLSEQMKQLQQELQNHTPDGKKK